MKCFGVLEMVEELWGAEQVTIEILGGGEMWGVGQVMDKLWVWEVWVRQEEMWGVVTGEMVGCGRMDGVGWIMDKILGYGTDEG